MIECADGTAGSETSRSRGLKVERPKSLELGVSDDAVPV
jgi:hypothetical protein